MLVLIADSVMKSLSILNATNSHLLSLVSVVHDNSKRQIKLFYKYILRL